MKATNWVIVLCVLSSVFAWNVPSPQRETLLSYLVFSGENLSKWRIWTPITALFLHADLMHLVGNMIFLFVFGNTLEKELNSGKTLAAFFIGGILSFLLSTYFYGSETVMVGASASIFTLTSIVMLVKPLKFSFLFLMPQGLVAIVYFIYNVVAVYFNFPGSVAFISHVIGFMIGIPLGISWSKNWKRNLMITFGLLILYYTLQIILFQVLGTYGLFQ